MEKNKRKKFYIDKSKIEGVGVFASKEIKRGELVFVMKGETLFLIERTKKDSLKNPNRVGISENTWIYPKPPALFINHSCNPNLGIRGRVWFVALRSIRKGEELTFDYSISEDSKWEMLCKCGEKRCRKVILGIRELPRDFYERYLPYVPKYFQKVYKECSQK